MAALLDETPGAVEAGPGRRGHRHGPDRRLRAAARDPRRRSGAGIFAALVDEDTYTVASEVHDLLVKTHAADTEKIELIKALVWEFLEIDRFLDAATEARVA